MNPTNLKAFLLQSSKAGHPVCITGQPGIGKTDIVKQAARELGYHLMICHPAVDDPIDYKGLPGITNGQAEFLPYGNLRDMMNASEPTIVFFDDLGQASEAVQKALMQLLLSRSLNGQKISDHIRFIAATNRKEDKAGVSGLLEPVKSRFAAIVNLEVSSDDWHQWAIQDGISPTLIAFNKHRPNLIMEFKPTKDMTNSPCPRTYANLDKLIKLQLPIDVRVDAYHGAIGNAAGEFLAFEQMAESLIAPDEILKNPANSKLPDRSRPDVCYATVIGLASVVKHDSVPAMLEYLTRFDAAGLMEYAVLGATTMYNRDNSLGNCQAFAIWCSKHAKNII